MAKQIKKVTEEKAISPTVNVPQETKICNRCKHLTKMHYGGESGHCNMNDCACLENL